MKTELIFVKKIVIQEVLIQMINHYTFKYFLKKQKNRNWSLIFTFTILTFLKTGITFAIFSFFRKYYFFRGRLRSIKENDLYKVVEMNNTIIVKTFVVMTQWPCFVSPFQKHFEILEIKFICSLKALQ